MPQVKSGSVVKLLLRNLSDWEEPRSNCFICGTNKQVMYHPFIGSLCTACISVHHQCCNCGVLLKEGEGHPREMKDSGKTVLFCSECDHRCTRERHCFACGFLVDTKDMHQVRPCLEGGPEYSRMCLWMKTESILPVRDTLGRFASGVQACMCRSCYRNGTGLINNYFYKPSPTFLSGNKDPSQMFYGIENELAVEKGFSLGEALELLPDFMYPKRDSSISRGFETVTHPVTFEWLKSKTPALNELFTKLREKGCYIDSSCGMHVHLSRDEFTPLQLFRFMKFIYSPWNRRFIIFIADRTTGEFSWSLDITDSIIKERAFEWNNAGLERHHAVNLGSNSTIEVRIFAGTLSVEHLMKNVEFCKALWEYTQYKKELTSSAFLSWVRPKEYPNLHHFTSSYTGG